MALSPHRERLSLAADELLALLPALADSSQPDNDPGGAPLSLAESYQACRRLILQHSRSFFFSSHFLPLPKRLAVRALYAFCRTTDDTVDLTPNDPARALATWVRTVRTPALVARHPTLLAWDDTCRSHSLPAGLANELLAGVAMDLTIHRYATFADLWLYCYRVASVVGLLSMHIVGFAPGAEPYAIKLGVALQLTNILRDIGEDARRGRIYLPQEDLARFGLNDDDILAERVDARFQALMRFEIARARQLYAESWPGVALLASDSRLAIGAASHVYGRILDKIAANNYDVFRLRAHLSTAEKLALLPGLWRKVRKLG
ncbi:MAG: squalene/phytoene synthase family protein [Chloroflexales bacterium]|nr:squalene/phytoene synthase family protein [Chloroflexales bacterium]